jgi:hypothetical protein
VLVLVEGLDVSSLGPEELAVVAVVVVGSVVSAVVGAAGLETLGLKLGLNFFACKHSDELVSE